MKRRRHYTQEKKMDYDDYIKEREILSNGEQTTYQSYEKAILTLSASFLAFSVAFVGLFKIKTPSGSEAVSVMSPALLALAWILFAMAVFLMLLNFVVNALAFRREIFILEQALKDIKELEKRKNNWTAI